MNHDKRDLKQHSMGATHDSNFVAAQNMVQTLLGTDNRTKGKEGREQCITRRSHNFQ
jgi:hypothetical protein